MNIRFQKWGNSVAVRIPSAFLKDLNLKEGQFADLSIENGNIVLTPIAITRRYALEELVAGITENNRHDGIDFGQPVGSEIW